MNFYEDFLIKSAPTGSNYICNPPVTDTDIDTIMLCKPGYESYLEGWEPCIGEGYEILGGDFQAWRKGNKNYIITCNPEWYKKFVLATRICKMLNLTDKTHRIFMFKIVMDRAQLDMCARNMPPVLPDVPATFTTESAQTYGGNQFVIEYGIVTDDTSVIQAALDSDST